MRETERYNDSFFDTNFRVSTHRRRITVSLETKAFIRKILGSFTYLARHASCSFWVLFPFTWLQQFWRFIQTLGLTLSVCNSLYNHWVVR